MSELILKKFWLFGHKKREKDASESGTADPGDFVENPKPDADSSPFLYSLETLKPDDIAPEQKKKTSPYTVAYRCVRLLLLVFSLGVFCWSMYTVLSSLVGYWRAEMLYASLSSDDFEEELPAGVSPKSRPLDTLPDYATALRAAGNPLDEHQDVKAASYNEKFESMKAKLNSLSIKNPDVFGWIKIRNTVIDYPIMHYSDNEYYLNHTYTGDFLQAGSIFSDYRCYTSIMKNFHLILYGHNMRNGLMFNNVMNYLDEKFFDENPYIEIYTFDGIYTYEVFAIYETRYDYDYIRTAFENYDQFIEYCEKLRANSLYVREGIEFKENDRLLTLSTCTNNITETGRYALHAVLVGAEK